MVLLNLCHNYLSQLCCAFCRDFSDPFVNQVTKVLTPDVKITLVNEQLSRCVRVAGMGEFLYFISALVVVK
jgi:hypothetical protein